MTLLTPTPRTDGLCLNCEGERPATPRGTNITAEQLAADPFCSAVCAKRWYGTSLGSGICTIHYASAA